MDFEERRTLTPQMTHYITTGTCPYCGVAILPPDYISRNGQDMLGRLERWWYRLPEELLAPAGAKVEVDDRDMTCMTCMTMWEIFQPYPSSWDRVRFTATPTRSPSIDVADYQLIDVKDEQQIETVLGETKKKYSNDSSVATITQEISISNSVTRAVTTEDEKIKASGGQAGVQIFGFATIEGQIQQQLSHRYSVETEQTLSISEKTTIEIPPLSTIEHTITWKLVGFKGNAILGKTSMTLVEVPYWIPRRLTYDSDVRDVPRSKNRVS
jgi:hypothetical protein